MCSEGNLLFVIMHLRHLQYIWNEEQKNVFTLDLCILSDLRRKWLGSHVTGREAASLVYIIYEELIICTFPSVSGTCR